MSLPWVQLLQQGCHSKEQSIFLVPTKPILAFILNSYQTLSSLFQSFGLVVLTGPSYFFVFHLDSSQRTPLFVSKVFPSKPCLFYSSPPRVGRNSFWSAQQTRPDPIVKERKHYTCHACLSATPFFLSHSNFSYLSNIERKYQVCLIPRNQRLVISEYEKSWGEAWLGCEFRETCCLFLKTLMTIYCLCDIWYLLDEIPTYSKNPKWRAPPLYAELLIWVWCFFNSALPSPLISIGTLSPLPLLMTYVLCILCNNVWYILLQVLHPCSATR